MTQGFPNCFYFYEPAFVSNTLRLPFRRLINLRKLGEVKNV